jgi:hypothetical protein
MHRVGQTACVSTKGTEVLWQKTIYCKRNRGTYIYIRRSLIATYLDHVSEQSSLPYALYVLSCPCPPCALRTRYTDAISHTLFN